MSGDRIAIACSGGPDSLAALFSITALARAGHLPLPVCVLHYHHGMRGVEADADADYVIDINRRVDVTDRIAAAADGEALSPIRNLGERLVVLEHLFDDFEGY